MVSPSNGHLLEKKLESPLTIQSHGHGTSSPPGQVGYTAMGLFSDHTSRELSQADGLSWKTSPTSTGTVAATIGTTGEATCSAAGTVTVTASAPENLQVTVNNGVQNTPNTATGTASLTCQ